MKPHFKQLIFSIERNILFLFWNFFNKTHEALFFKLKANLKKKLIK